MSSPFAGAEMITFFAPGGEVALGLLALGEQARRLDHVVDAQLLPRQLGGRLGADDRDLLAVDDQHVVGFLVGARLLRADLAGELLLRRIVLQQVGEVVGGNDVADRDDLDVLAEQSLLVKGPENQPSDAAEPIDRDTSAHFNLPSSGFDVCRCALYMTCPTAPSHRAKSPNRSPTWSPRQSASERDGVRCSRPTWQTPWRQNGSGGSHWLAPAVRAADERADRRRLRAAAGGTAAEADLPRDAIGRARARRAPTHVARHASSVVEAVAVALAAAVGPRHARTVDEGVDRDGGLARARIERETADVPTAPSPPPSVADAGAKQPCSVQTRSPLRSPGEQLQQPHVAVQPSAAQGRRGAAHVGADVRRNIRRGVRLRREAAAVRPRRSGRVSETRGSSDCRCGASQLLP